MSKTLYQIIRHDDLRSTPSYYKQLRTQRAAVVRHRASRIGRILRVCGFRIARDVECPIHGKQHAAILAMGLDIDNMRPDENMESYVCPATYLMWRIMSDLMRGERTQYGDKEHEQLFVRPNG